MNEANEQTEDTMTAVIDLVVRESAELDDTLDTIVKENKAYTYDRVKELKNIMTNTEGIITDCRTESKDIMEKIKDITDNMNTRYVQIKEDTNTRHMNLDELASEKSNMRGLMDQLKTDHEEAIEEAGNHDEAKLDQFSIQLNAVKQIVTSGRQSPIARVDEIQSDGQDNFQSPALDPWGDNTARFRPTRTTGEAPYR